MCFELELAVEMVLDDALVAAGDEDEMLDAGLARLVDHVLDQRPVDHRQHLLRHGLGGGQEPGAEPGDGKTALRIGFMIMLDWMWETDWAAPRLPSLALSLKTRAEWPTLPTFRLHLTDC